MSDNHSPHINDELENLQNRIMKLSGEKAQYQLIIYLIENLIKIPGIDNTIENMLKSLLETIGGSNIIIYYIVDDITFYADVLGNKGIVDRIDDVNVIEVFKKQEFIETIHNFQTTMLKTPEFTKAISWYFPIKTEKDIVGVVILENQMGTLEMKKLLQTFFSYAAVILKNEIMGYTKLSIANEKLKKVNKKLLQEIDERRQVEETLKYLSFHDSLTGLYNRAFFEEELQRLANSRDYPITMISTDINGLKLINDTIGHQKGDQLLKAAASVLTESLRNSDMLARIGGDEFFAILSNTDKKTGEEVAARIRKKLSQYNDKHVDLSLSLSLGVATSNNRQESLTELFKKADDLMYRDKLYRSASARNKIVRSLLATLAERDFITEGHTQRLAKYCQRIGEEIALSSQQLSDLVLLSQVHDLGKVGIPDAILFKEGPLNDEEWKVMCEHPEKGYRIASSSPELSGIADLILKHHEKWDGTGYPLEIKGTTIPIECRILSIVDAFDAMTSDRPYRKAKSRKKAIEELKKCTGTQFDPELIEVFLSILEK